MCRDGTRDMPTTPGPAALVADRLDHRLRDEQDNCCRDTPLQSPLPSSSACRGPDQTPGHPLQDQIFEHPIQVALAAVRSKEIGRRRLKRPDDIVEPVPLPAGVLAQLLVPGRGFRLGPGTRWLAPAVMGGYRPAISWRRPVDKSPARERRRLRTVDRSGMASRWLLTSAGGLGTIARRCGGAGVASPHHRAAGLRPGQAVPHSSGVRHQNLLDAAIYNESPARGDLCAGCAFFLCFPGHANGPCGNEEQSTITPVALALLVRAGVTHAWHATYCPVTEPPLPKTHRKLADRRTGQRPQVHRPRRCQTTTSSSCCDSREAAPRLSGPLSGAASSRQRLTGKRSSRRANAKRQ